MWSHMECSIACGGFVCALPCIGFVLSVSDCGVSRGGASGERAELRSRVDGLTADKRRLGAVADELRQGVCPLACGRVHMRADCGCVLASVI